MSSKDDVIVVGIKNLEYHLSVDIPDGIIYSDNKDFIRGYGRGMQRMADIVRDNSKVESINLTELSLEIFKKARNLDRRNAHIYWQALADLLASVARFARRAARHEAVVRHGSPQVRKGGKK